VFHRDFAKGGAVPRRAIITLTTDFGLRDPFVGIMKGVILGLNPEVELVDLSHQINSHDILDGAFTLFESYRFFPPDSIHLVVVDPGVGSGRRPILARTLKHAFVAPDNGVLSLVVEREEAVEVRHVTADQYFLKPVSNTFHGRDVFAPVAGWLSRGIEPDKFGEVITDYVRTAPGKPPRPQRINANEVRGAVLKIDKFGNVITNLAPEDVPELFRESPPPFRIVVNRHEIARLASAYAGGGPAETVAILGSAGFLELVTNLGSAAEGLGAGVGKEVSVVFGGPTQAY
jgi:S-adenosyl-L-methionine hydrolase (adenosine-forming)